VAGDAPFVIGSAVTLVTTGRVNLPFDHMTGEEIPPVHKFPVRPVAVLDRRLHFHFIGMTVVAKRWGMAGNAQLGIPACVKAVIAHKPRGMAKGLVGLENSPDLVLMAFGTGHATFAQGFGMGCGKTLFLGKDVTAGGHYKEATHEHDDEENSGPDHFFAPLYETVKS
jgi:hypothetical protein